VREKLRACETGARALRYRDRALLLSPEDISMHVSLRALAATVALGLGVAVAQPALADVPGPHPEYVHALNDLRYAHWLLHVPAEWNVTRHEREATAHVDRAFADIRQAGFDDGKDVYAELPVDASLSHRDRLQRALSSLERAHADINGWESDPYARGPRGAADGELDAAIAQVRFALHDQYRDNTMGY
jgi:hypothetical protein